MNLCSDNHEEICYEGRNCPLCAAKSDLSDEIKTLKQTIDDQEERIAELEEEIK